MNSAFKFLFAVTFIFCLSKSNIFAQGCVAIRSTGGICTMDEHPDSTNTTHGLWLFNSNSRYYRSFRHFVGKQEQYQRIDVLHNNVINYVFTEDLSLTRVFNSRWSMSVILPFADNTRSQVSAGTRYSTHSFGIGDLRAAGYFWLFNAEKSHNANVQIGLGVKFPTGTYDYKDYFLQADGSKVLGPVDQSIQLGDGGTGITAEVNAFYNLSHSFGFYGNFFYLANPRDVNGTPRSANPPTAIAIATTADVQSVPDQMLIRAGAGLGVKKWRFIAGLRDDYLPTHDLLGNSDGFRRPGHIFSAEPGVNYVLKNVFLYAYFPIAILRDRFQSVPDKRATDLTGVYTHGDAAFADYVINLGVTVKF